MNEVTVGLREIQAEHGANWTRTDGDEVIGDYGDAAAEYEAIVKRVGLADRSARGKLRVTGADRAHFLHGMLTNTVEDLLPGEGNHSALTDPKGNTQADLHLFNRGEEIFLETEPGLQLAVAAFVDRFLIADDVVIKDVSGGWSILGVQGPGSIAVLATLGVELPGEQYGSVAMTTPQGGWIARRAYVAEVGFDIWVPTEEAGGLWVRLVEAGALPSGFAALELRRIERGQPRYGLDVDDAVVPLEAGLEDTVSFTKGCFIGQETLAKMHNLGKPRRYLVGLQVESEEPPATGTPIFNGDKEVGTVRSSARSVAIDSTIALASVRRGSEIPGTSLRLGETGRATVSELPFSP